MNCALMFEGCVWKLWCVYCVCLCVCVLGVIDAAVRVCCVAEKGLFLLLPHVPMVRFDPPLQWFVVIVARLYVVVCGLTTCDCAV